MNVTETISIILVDDDQRFRQGLKTLLSFYTINGSLSVEIVGEAATQEQALKIVTRLSPNLILLDLELAKGDGIITLLKLKEISYPGKVLVLSGHQEDDWIFKAMQAGAAGYVFKTRLATQLYDAINTISKSEVYLPAEVASGFFRRFQASSDLCWQARRDLYLTEREQEVLNCLIQGYSNEEIAKHLYVTVATVKAHLTSIFEKLNVTSRTQAIVTALKLGLIQD